MKVRAIVTDIEGTTSAISFVHEILFPYASRELPEFVRRENARPDVAAILEDVRREANEPDAGLDRVIALLREWIAADRKITALKALQGLIWTAGYENGDFVGHIYDDAAGELRRWHDAGVPLYVYSSGSVKAQKLLFAHSAAGDLTPIFEGYFDTRTGAKNEQLSYEKIAAEIGLPGGDILFLSDVVAELDAARDAGMQTTQLKRDDAVVTGSHVLASDFTEVAISCEPDDDPVAAAKGAAP